MTMLSDPFRAIDDHASTITPPVPRPQKPVRLRLACDACTAAKVRCSKTHPCERCIDNGQECFYSASRRHGKRSRHRKAESDAQRSSSSEVPTPGAIPVPNGIKGISYGSEFSWEERETSPQLSSYQASTLGNGIGKLDNWAFHDIDMMFDFDDTSYISLNEPWKTTPGSLTSQQTLSETITPPEQHTTPAEQPANATLTPPIEPHDPKQAHDCEALALGVLRSLHHHNADGICKGPAANGMNLAKPMPSIDTVLFANKAALTNLIPLLKCPCARNPHIALLHSTILSKTIFWYRVAVTARYHAEGAELRPMKIQLGMLDLDDDDQATLQRAVLLRELRKAEKVMEKFDACSASEDEVPKWHTTAIQNMKEELQAIIQKIKKGQGEWA
ncbi:Zn(2)-C6 fungal-type domain-containing protein [Fusarium falciforme]|uniref:Zn(2)-C6 fungal-type domain-containing protein n=1 Tax=Fusarium falciforme TaxID=195108 RepID=UPI0023014C66|nr:Zn(2)-C6 fungal-type domain-containing protein [Fusarium falciforme]WAO94646.1 Zn(2)-C6 fungal-type domain-containing protein [Fusarium falciforme]